MLVPYPLHRHVLIFQRAYLLNVGSLAIALHIILASSYLGNDVRRHSIQLWMHRHDLYWGKTIGLCPSIWLDCRWAVQHIICNTHHGEECLCVRKCANFIRAKV